MDDRNKLKAAPIGIFDSGLGGLSVWREIVRQLPAEATFYVADQAHVPYGPRSREEIHRFSHAITRFLLDQGAKLIVVACNTASGAALYALRDAYPDISFVGMEPAVKPAAERTHNGIVGVLATPTTFQSDLFKRLVERFAHHIEIHTQVCPGLVEAVEAGRPAAPETRALLQTCLQPLIDANIDQLVLGCTHYPFLEAPIRDILGPDFPLIDPAPAVARQVGRVLKSQNLCHQTGKRPHHTLSTTGDERNLRAGAGQMVGYRGNTVKLTWCEDSLRIV
jgi:glutamate racemase